MDLTKSVQKDRFPALDGDEFGRNEGLFLPLRWVGAILRNLSIEALLSAIGRGTEIQDPNKQV